MFAFHIYLKFNIILFKKLLLKCIRIPYGFLHDKGCGIIFIAQACSFGGIITEFTPQMGSLII